MNTTAEVIELLRAGRVTLRTTKGVLMDFDVLDAKEVTTKSGLDGMKGQRIELRIVSTSAPRLARD